MDRIFTTVRTGLGLILFTRVNSLLKEFVKSGGKMKFWNILFCISAIAAINSCMSSEYSTDTNNAGGGLSGTMVNAQGVPVADALVKAYPASTTGGVLAKVAVSSDSSIDTAVLDSTWTNAKGQYNFPNLKDGNYNLEGTLYQNGDTLVVSHRGVHFNGTTNLGSDTLKAPGLILIEAEWNGTPLPGVHCNIVGGSQAAVSDDSGRCLIANVPPGVFQVQLLNNGYLPDTSGNIWVYSEKFTDAGILTLTPLPPVPDTAMGCWHLWQSNGYTGTLFIYQQGGDKITDSMSWVSTVSKPTNPDTGSGTDSASSIYFSLTFSSVSPIIGYYTGTVKGDSLVNGISKSNEGDEASWSASRIACPD